MKLNQAKLNVSRKVEFGGLMINSSQVNGKPLVEMEPTADKIEALLDMDRPKTVRQAQQVLGTVNQVSRWVPGLSLNIPILKKSTSARTKFQWTEAMEKEWEKMKEILQERVKLSPVDTKLPLELYTDASYFSIGYCLLQPRGGGNRGGQREKHYCLGEHWTNLYSVQVFTC